MEPETYRVYLAEFGTEAKSTEGVGADTEAGKVAP